MKDRDISRAIGELPDDLRAEFDEWQEKRAPLTEPVISRSHGKDIHLRIWSAGIGTAVAASLVIGVSVGRDALHHANEAVSSPAAEIAEQSAPDIAEQHTPAEMLAETAVREPVPLELLAQFGGRNARAPKVPAEGAVQVLRSMDDLQPLIDATDGYGPDGDDEAFFDSQGLNAETFGEYDVLYFAYPAGGNMPDGLYQREFCGAEYRLDGSLDVLFSDLLLEDPPEGFRRDSQVDQDWSIYYFCKVPKDSLPDIETVSFDFPAHYVGGLPDDVRENWSAAGDPDAAPSERRTKLQLYLESTQEYLDWVMTCPKKLWVTWEPENAVPLVGCGWFTGSHSTEIAVPPEGMAEVIRSMEDAQPFIDALSHGNAQFTMSDYLNAEWLREHDILFCGIDPDAYWQIGLSAGQLRADGVLDLQFSALNRNAQSDDSILPGADDRFYWYCSVPKNTLPQITDAQITVQQYADYAEYSGTVCGKKYLLRTSAQSGEVRTADAAFPSEPFSAWFWSNYFGDDIPLPDGLTVRMIRTAADAKPYLTGSEAQEAAHPSLGEHLTAEWLEQAHSFGKDNAEEEPAQDLIFIGIPEDRLPPNCAWYPGLQSGTVTADGYLHLDLSLYTVSDALMKDIPEQYRDRLGKNAYFFISVPDGTIPDLTGWDVSLTAFASAQEPDEQLIAADPERWWASLPERQDAFLSVAGSKTITPLQAMPENTVYPLLTQVTNSPQPLEKATAELAKGAIILNEKENTEGKPQSDLITLHLPVSDVSAKTAITDLSVSQDGILSLTLHEYYDAHGIDLTQYTASTEWTFMVPRGSVPEIRDVQIERIHYDAWNLDESLDGGGFMKAAGTPRTIRLTAARNTRNVMIEGILEMRTDGTIETPTAAIIRSEAEYAEMQKQYSALQEDIYDPERNNLLLILPMQAGEGDFTINSVEIRGGEVYATITLETSDAKHTEPEYRMNSAAVCRLTVTDPLPDIRPALHLTVQYDSELAITELMKAMPYTDYIAVSD